MLSRHHAGKNLVSMSSTANTQMDTSVTVHCWSPFYCLHALHLVDKPKGNDTDTIEPTVHLQASRDTAESSVPAYRPALHAMLDPSSKISTALASMYLLIKSAYCEDSKLDQGKLRHCMHHKQVSERPYFSAGGLSREWC